MTQSQTFPSEIPADTARLARAIFPPDELYLQIGDNLNDLLADADFADVYPPGSPLPAVSADLLAMTVIFQLVEWLTDDQVALNTKARIDWKYALHLGLNAPGFEVAAIVDFRQRLLSHRAAMHRMNRLLGQLTHLGLYIAWDQHEISNARI